MPCRRPSRSGPSAAWRPAARTSPVTAAAAHPARPCRAVVGAVRWMRPVRFGTAALPAKAATARRHRAALFPVDADSPEPSRVAFLAAALASVPCRCWFRAAATALGSGPGARRCPWPRDLAMAVCCGRERSTTPALCAKVPVWRRCAPATLVPRSRWVVGSGRRSRSLRRTSAGNAGFSAPQPLSCDAHHVEVASQALRLSRRSSVARPRSPPLARSGLGSRSGRHGTALRAARESAKTSSGGAARKRRSSAHRMRPMKNSPVSDAGWRPGRRAPR